MPHTNEFMKCGQCQDKSGDEGEKWCSACENNFNYIWDLENECQLLWRGYDRMKDVLKGLKLVTGWSEKKR